MEDELAYMIQYLTVPANAEEPTVHQGGEGGVPASADHRRRLDLQTENCHPKWRKCTQRHPHSDHQISWTRLCFKYYDKMWFMSGNALK